MYELKRPQDVFFEILDELGDSVGVGPCFATVVAGSESVGVVCLIDKGAMGFKNFLIAGLKPPVKGGEDGFVDEGMPMKESMRYFVRLLPRPILTSTKRVGGP
jgi:hypothetical protein